MIDISLLIHLTDVYVLVDADNVQLNLNHIKQITAFAKYFGYLKEYRVYGDWENEPLNAHIGLYDNYKVEYIQRIQVYRNEKNATDYYMMMDIGALLGEDGFSSGIFIIVSGDGIFASVAQFVGNKGGRVISISGSKKSTSKKLAESYGKVYFLEDLEQELLDIQKDYPIPLGDIKLFQALLLQIYDDIASKDWRWVSYDELDTKLREKFPAYVHDLEKYPLSVWLSYPTPSFSIRNQKVQRIDPYPELTRRMYLIKVFIELVREDKRIHLSHFGKKLREIVRNYEQEFGGKKLTHWIKEYPDDFKVEGDYIISLTIRI